MAISRHRFRWESNIKTDLGEVGWEGMAGTHLVHGRDKWQAVMNMVINLLSSIILGNFLTGCSTVSFSRRILFYVFSQFVSHSVR